MNKAITLIGLLAVVVLIAIPIILNIVEDIKKSVVIRSGEIRKVELNVYLINGIWVGKFEITGTGDNSTILSNLTSLRNQSISTKF